MYPYLGTTNIEMYNLLGFFSIIVLFWFNLLQLNQKKHLLSARSVNIINYFDNKNKCGKKNNFLSSEKFWAFIETILISCFQYLPVSFLNTKFGNWVGTGANYFGLAFSAPIILMVVCCVIRVNPLKQIDLITPAFPIALYFSKLACFCCGCCQGIQWKHGFYNHNYDLVEFPSQLVEAMLALFIFIFLLFWRKKARTGTLYPMYLILFCTTRFFSEFTRAEENVFGILKTYHILCIIGLVVGVIGYLIMYKYGERIGAYFDNIFFNKRTMLLGGTEHAD